MKVRYETKTVRQVDYCCEEMKKAEAGKAIVFPPSTAGLIQPSIFGPNNDPEIARGPIAYPIRFCPFCAEQILYQQ